MIEYKENFDFKNNYSILNNNIEDTRFLTVQSDNHRFRIILEVATGCYGSCDGCSLSVLGRNEIKENIEINRIKDILNYFIPIIKNNEEIQVPVVNLGVGDYFALNNDFLLNLFKEIDVFFKQLNKPRSILTVSTSLLLNADKMEEKIKNIITYLHPNQFAFDVVLDPARIEKYYDKYSENLKTLQKYFPFSDMVINVSNHLNPESAILITKFLKEHKVLNVDIQYAINKNNHYRVKIDYDKFDKFVSYLYGNLPSDLLDLSIAQSEQDFDLNIYEEFNKQADDILKERFFVNEKGNIYPVAFAIGDIILDERMYFEPIGNIYNKSIDFKDAKLKIVNYLKKIYMKTKVCQLCKYKNKCYGTGYAFYNVFQKNKFVCENPGVYYFKKIDKNEE